MSSLAFEARASNTGHQGWGFLVFLVLRCDGIFFVRMNGLGGGGSGFFCLRNKMAAIKWYVY